jgi:hypothetical protein
MVKPKPKAPPTPAAKPMKTETGLPFDADTMRRLKPIKTGFLFDPDFMRRLRVAAAEHDVQLRDLVILAVERLLADTKREGLDLHALVAKREKKP